MKKVVSIVMTFVLIVMCSAVYVFAADETSTQIDKNDPLYIQLQAKYATLEGLRSQYNQLASDVKTQQQSNKSSIQGTVKKAKEDAKGQLVQFNQQIQDLKTQAQPLIDQRKTLKDSLKLLLPIRMMHWYRAFQRK
jgi:preprotein translocase subunit SecF